MLEGLVAWVLNNYLGKYVENLNTDQLSVALLSGKVELENLPLKKDALRHLGLPVEIKAGFIGKVQLQVPVRQIRSAPWLISIDKLYLVATPLNLDEWDAGAEAQYAHERKVALLDALEAQWRAQHEAADAGYYAASYSSWLSYGTGLLANIVENLQLKLSDVHVRYEDRATCGRGFACGLTVAALCADSCDAEWRRGFTLLPDRGGCSFKLLELQRLALYWDPLDRPADMLAHCDIHQLAERMCETWKGTHRYVLWPASASARVRRERTEQPLRSRTRPRLSAHLTLDTVQLDLTDRQYVEAVQCSSGLERLQRLREVRARRPAVPVRGHARAWWIYALAAHQPHHAWTEPAPTWESCAAAARAARTYVAACARSLAAPAATLPPDLQAAKDDYEWRTPLHILKPLREVAIRQVPVSSPVSSPDQPGSSGRSMLVQWFPQWWGWYDPAPDPAAAPGPAPAPPDLEEEILDVIADSLENNTLLKRDTVFGKFEFVLNKGSLNLSMDCDEQESEGQEQHAGESQCASEGQSSSEGQSASEGQSSSEGQSASEGQRANAGQCGDEGQSARGRVELAFSAVRVEVEARPRAGSHALHVSLGTLCLRDLVTPDTLFPIIAAPQGVIREGLSATGAGGAWSRPRAPLSPAPTDPLFQLSYEKKPLNSTSDHKLWVKSGSVEVVYCAGVGRWARAFLRAPWAGAEPSLRHSTRAKLITHWEHMMRAGERGERSSWQVELDISAPQILFAENLSSRSAAVLLVDFGRLRLANASRGGAEPAAELPPEPAAEPPLEGDDEETFMTPCSTPPASLLSPASLQSPAAAPPAASSLAQDLHDRLYDRYDMELSSLQILVGRARDNWQYAHTKATSALHLLDRFSIRLGAERRAVRTADPAYPLATLRAHLPALVAHLSEHKLAAVHAVLRNVLRAHQPPQRSPAARAADDDEVSTSSDTERSEHAHNSTQLMLQFAIDQMSLEVQSRGRSIAEVQVMGVRAAAARRPRDTSLSLSVHSLLLVDALQTYGPDFELLVASHKHVGMDTASGSIRGSEPTSPTSPASPTSPHGYNANPLALSQALHSLHQGIIKNTAEKECTSPTPAWFSGTNSTNYSCWGSGNTWGPAGTVWGSSGNPGGAAASTWGGNNWGAAGGHWGAAGLVDSEALIAVELCFVKGDGDSEDLQIANILFNNLDIIANQETIVELIGFAQRVTGPRAEQGAPPAPAAPPPAPPVRAPRTEISFDFHRLGVLLLRAAVQDGAVVARKIATATICEARIQASVDGEQVCVGGSLGGVHVVSLCERGPHARVLCAGRAAPPAPPALPPAPTDHDKALLFNIERSVRPPRNGDEEAVEVCVSTQVARVWYTHSPALVLELRSCLAEFTQYLANLARSIRAAAADMALGLVHAAPLDARRRTTSAQDPEPAPARRDDIVLSVSVELESPVVVLPRGARSPQVLVAHLGRMALHNRPAPLRRALYTVRVRDIALHSLDVSETVGRAPLSADNMAEVYCVSRGTPVLHNTAVKVAVNVAEAADGACACTVQGAVVGGLQVSARRDQYEQLLDTLAWISAGGDAPPASATVGGESAADVVDPAVPTLRLDPAVRAAVLAVPPPAPRPAPPAPPAPLLPLHVKFELGMFRVELRADLGEGERSLVALSFREFALRYRRTCEHETTLQVSLHSVTMEDLTKEPESRHRTMMVSHAPHVPPKAVFVSRSCPDFRPPAARLPPAASLPAHLNLLAESKERASKRQDSKCGPTPPCSPECGERHYDDHDDDDDDDDDDRDDRGDDPEDDDSLSGDDNLVRVWVHTRDPAHPRFHDTFNKVCKLTRVEFNCLQLVVSIDSWVAVLDFFGVAGDEPAPPPAACAPPESNSEVAEAGWAPGAGCTQTEMSIRSLGVVVVGWRGEACRALVSRVRVTSRAEAGGARALQARLGALQLADLTPHAPLWRDRLRTHTKRALAFKYHRLSGAEAEAAGHDTSLQLEMGAVSYVHTRRFVSELHAFARDFSLLRRVIAQARAKVAVGGGSADGRAARCKLDIRCEAPCIILPVSGRARAALAAQLHRLHLTNTFRLAGDPDTVSARADPASPCREVLDVRSVELESLTLRAARGGDGELRLGPPLLTAPAHLTLRLEHNLSPTHNVADMTVQGTLTTLECVLEPAQYRLVRGVLAHNLADGGDEQASPAPPPVQHHQVWTTSSLQLELQDVRVRLEPAKGSSLACINFIKSRLVIDTYSDFSRDIDLVSQEIQVSDTRYVSEPANRRGNVFTNIVQPMPDHPHSVQAEVHARNRRESSAYTILVNNMRLMAVLDWWEGAAQFISQPPHPPADPDQQPLEEAAPGPLWGGGARGPAAEPPQQMELKLNITDSQLVLVEDASVWDTNAVILRSTTVLTYRVAEHERPVSCSLSGLEVFSCVLGLEDETALAIVEPANLHVSIDHDRVLHISMGTLDLRLSYHDMRMFAAMLHSLPVQARAALSGKTVLSEEEEDAPANSVHMRAGSGRWGAPRWLRDPPPAPAPPPPPTTSSIWPLKAVKVSGECVTLCVIDDCLDSDVPLLEVALADLTLDQDLRKVEEAFEDPVLVSTPAGAGGVPGSAAEGAGGAGSGRLAASLAVDYYNRPLSGWEPVIEPWKFEARWEYTLSSSLARARVQVSLSAAELLNVTVTAALLALVRLVRDNWTADYYTPQSGGAEQSPKGSPAGHRRRSPFVPYALRNHTGHRLWFTTITTSADVLEESQGAVRPDDSWVCVRAGDTEPFSFGGRRRAARPQHHSLQQLALRCDGWEPPDPVCVTQVGTYFRNITHTKSGCRARLVLAVTLEGSARKLVTVRSALLLHNRLPHALEVRVDHAPAPDWERWRTFAGRRALRRSRAALQFPAAEAPPTLLGCAQWVSGGARCTTVRAGESWAAPLCARAGALWVRPLCPGAAPPAPAALDWRAAPALLHRECRAPPDHVYRFCCAVAREPFPPDDGEPAPAHTLTLLPALRLENLLPVELTYRTSGDASVRAAPPGDVVPFHRLDVQAGVELAVKLEGFGWSTPLSVGGAAGAPASFGARLKLRDTRGRRLYLNAHVTVKKTDGILVSISAPYWVVNRTGLPLVFRAEGGAGEAAGQFAEHEVARMVAPLPFSFAEAEGGPTLAARLGRALAPAADWCAPFGLGPGVCVKRLTARADGEPERVYCVGVSVRAGRARYRRTNIATLTPRYQLHNNTRHRLQFAQRCAATTLADPGAAATHVAAVAGCHLPWHWPRWDRPHLLCVRALANDGEPATAWSGGFRLEAPRSLTLACREPSGRYHFVRVEVAAQGATLFVVFTDAESAPPPIVILNYSPVSVMFHQVGCTEECAVGAHGSARWALPEPEGAAALSLRAPGGPRTTLQLSALGTTVTLLYQNFIYVVFTATQGRGEEEPLVLEVGAGSTRVVLARKRYGDRAQLWRRAAAGQLVHEGSSVPQAAAAAAAEEAALSPHCLVLDIEEPAPRPGRASALVLRRADPRRASTQAWRLHAGRMCCAHSNLCVQPDTLTMQGLQVGARAVLGMPGPGRGGGGAVPAEQAVAWHSLRPGSGRLEAALAADGPTRRVTVRDARHPAAGWLDAAEREDEVRPAREWGAAVSLAGVGVSLVAEEELVHAVLWGVRAAVTRAPISLHASLAVQDMQWDNQLADASAPVLLQTLGSEGAALDAALELGGARRHAVLCRHACLALRPLAVRLEERLLLELWLWARGHAAEPPPAPDEAEYETRRMLDELTALHATRYYFALLKIMPSQIRLSMTTASKLEGPLLALKRRLGLTLIKFEDAGVELEPFVRTHVFETAAFLSRQMYAHFKDELKWQAAKILGSVDFLGNPLGFVADVSEGVSGLLLEGNVGALLKNVTHGISNSAAKVSESLGDGLERVVADEAHEETRRRIRSEAAGGHLAAGLRGLSLGILGGVTSLVKHSYEGAAADGVGGFIAGVGKGLVGTVAKPVIGVLDLAAETASAVRESSRRGSRRTPGRVRGPRCARGAGGLLARYDAGAALGAQLLRQLNGGERGERFLAWRQVRGPPHDIRALLSDAHLRIFTCKQATPHAVMETPLGALVAVAPLAAGGAHYVELCVCGGGEAVRRPRVQCDSRELALWLARHAAYARRLHRERAHTLPPAPDPDTDPDADTY